MTTAVLVLHVINNEKLLRLNGQRGTEGRGGYVKTQYGENFG